MDPNMLRLLFVLKGGPCFLETLRGVVIEIRLPFNVSFEQDSKRLSSYVVGP